MKVLKFCPFFNENLVAKVHIAESESWVDEFHITEANRTFQNQSKGFFFNTSLCTEKVMYHQIDVAKQFKGSSLFDKVKARLQNTSYGPWYNERIQRNISCSYGSINDDDIIVLSDIDEIIDSKFADELIDLTFHKSIITVKLYFTLCFLNLYSVKWSGPSDYSYRVFLMTGKKFKDLAQDYDNLRKKGEHNLLINEIYCLNKIVGFHHSFLGDANFVKKKLLAYAHTEFRHLSTDEYIKKCISERKSIYPGHKLRIDRNIPLLRSINLLTEYEKKQFLL